jgi:hypothetical protein
MSPAFMNPAFMGLDFMDLAFMDLAFMDLVFMPLALLDWLIPGLLRCARLTFVAAGCGARAVPPRRPPVRRGRARSV